MLDQDTKISVILPTYNHARFIENSIKSILKAVKSNFELIIINDGSKDNTSDILKKYSSDLRIKIINQDNRGLAESLNIGFKLAKGRYLTWTSADNLYNKLALEKLAEYLDRFPDVDMVYANVELIDDNSKPFYKSNYRLANQDHKKSYILNLPRCPETLTCYSDNFINACFMYRSWIPKAIGGYKKELLGFEDYEYWLRILSVGKIAHIGSKEPLYKYRVHKESLTGKLNADKLSRDQRKTVSDFYNLKQCLPAKKYNVSGTKFINEKLEKFLFSLPLNYTYNPLTRVKIEVDAFKYFESDTPIEAPQILSRISDANYHAHFRSRFKKFTAILFIPDFIEVREIDFYKILIKKNSHIQFVCLCTTENQRIFANLLRNEIIVIDITTAHPPIDDLLPEEKYLPFVYSLANTSLLICPLPQSESKYCLNALMVLSAKAKIKLYAISDMHFDVPSFCELYSWESLISKKIKYKNETYDSSFNSCLTSFSVQEFNNKIENIINIYELNNISLSLQIK